MITAARQENGAPVADDRCMRNNGEFDRFPGVDLTLWVRILLALALLVGAGVAAL